MSTPLITIGITCYREGDWLLECWESVLAQTDDCWEAVLVMDGGADQRTQAIFQTLEHPKLRKYAFRENVGPYPVRNKAFELTNTAYHFYLDGDDKLPPTAVRLALETFTKHPSAGYVYGDREVFDGDEKLIQRCTLDPSPSDIVTNIPPGAYAYRTDLWKQIGGFNYIDFHLLADWDYLFTLADINIRGYHCGDIFYCYRQHHVHRVSRSQDEKRAHYYNLLILKHSNLFKRKYFRKQFMLQAYRITSFALIRKCSYWKASTMAIKAISCGGWKEKYLWAVIISPLLPQSINRVLYSYKNKYS